MIIISLFRVKFTLTFHNYKKLINVNLPMRPDTNSVTNYSGTSQWFKAYIGFSLGKKYSK